MAVRFTPEQTTTQTKTVRFTPETKQIRFRSDEETGYSLSKDIAQLRSEIGTNLKLGTIIAGQGALGAIKKRGMQLSGGGIFPDENVKNQFEVIQPDKNEPEITPRDPFGEVMSKRMKQGNVFPGTLIVESAGVVSRLPDVGLKALEPVYEETAKELPKVTLKESPITRLARPIVQNIPQRVAAIGLGLLTGNPAVALGLMGETQAGNQFVDSIKRGDSVLKSSVLADLSGAAEIGGEALVLPRVFKGFDEGLSVRQILDIVYQNAGQEGATGFTQTFLDTFGAETTKGTKLKDAIGKSALEGLKAIPENAWVGGVMGGGEATVAGTANAIVNKIAGGQTENNLSSDKESQISDLKSQISETSDVGEPPVPDLSGFKVTMKEGLVPKEQGEKFNIPASDIDKSQIYRRIVKQPEMQPEGTRDELLAQIDALDAEFNAAQGQITPTTALEPRTDEVAMNQSQEEDIVNPEEGEIKETENRTQETEKISLISDLKSQIEQRQAGQTDEQLSGITRRRRSSLIKQTAAQIAGNDIYKNELDAISNQEKQIDVGFYYVDPANRSDVEDIIGKRKGFPTVLQRMFTFDKAEANEKGALPWDVAAGETGIDGIGIREFVEGVKKAHENKERSAGLNTTALERAAKSGVPGLDMLAEKMRMLQDGSSDLEINNMIVAWANENEVPISEIADEFINPQKFEELLTIPDEQADAEIERIATEQVLQEEQMQGFKAAKEILAANGLDDVEVENVENIENRIQDTEYSDTIPFEQGSTITGAAITTGQKQIIYIALGGDMETGYHEAYHILRTRLSGSDRRILQAAFEDEEAEARAFANYAKTNKANSTKLRMVFNKILAILKKIKQALAGKGFRTVEDIFGEIQSGKIKLATEGTETTEKSLQFEKRDDKIFSMAKDEAARDNITPQETAETGREIQYYSGDINDLPTNKAARKIYLAAIEAGYRMPKPVIKKDGTKDFWITSDRFRYFDGPTEGRIAGTIDRLEQGYSQENELSAWTLILSKKAQTINPKYRDLIYLGILDKFATILPERDTYFDPLASLAEIYPNEGYEVFQQDDIYTGKVQSSDVINNIREQYPDLYEEKYKALKNFIIENIVFPRIFDVEDVLRIIDVQFNDPEAGGQEFGGAIASAVIQDIKQELNNNPKEFIEKAIKVAKKARIVLKEYIAIPFQPYNDVIFGMITSEKEQLDEYNKQKEKFLNELKLVESFLLESSFNSLASKEGMQNKSVKSVSEKENESRGTSDEPRIKFETSGDKLRREAERNARIQARKARLKAQRAAAKPKVSKRRIKINIIDTTPPLRADLATESQISNLKSQNIVPESPPPGKGKTLQKTILKKSFAEENRVELKRTLRDIIGEKAEILAEGFNKATQAMSSRLNKISPRLTAQVRRYIFDSYTRSIALTKDCVPMVKAWKKMSHNDNRDFIFWARNGQTEEIMALVQKYKIEKQYEQYRAAMDELYQAGNQVGLDIMYRQDYWPRVVKNFKGLTKYLASTEKWAPIQQALMKRQEAAGGRQLTEDEQSQVINTLLRGYNVEGVKLTRPGAAKERTIDVFDRNIEQFYYGLDESIAMYIQTMTQAIGAREFFGKTTKEITNLKAHRSRLRTSLYKLTTRQGLRKGWTENAYKDHIAKRWKLLEEVEKRLEKLKTQTYDDSVGYFTLELLKDKQINSDQQRELSQMLSAIFEPKGMRGAIRLFTKLAYIDVLAQPTVALTQLEELGLAFYQSKIKSLGAAARATVGKSKMKLADIGIDDINQYMNDLGFNRIGDALMKPMQITDKLGKEAFINTAIDKYRAMAKSKTMNAAFLSKMKNLFGAEAQQVIDDLKTGKTSDNVKFLAFCELSDVQPVSIAETPQYYAKGGNGRILYMLRSFTLRRLDMLRNKAAAVKNAKSVPEFAKALYDLTKLLFIMTAFGVGRDFLRKAFLGQEIKDDDLQNSVINNMLQYVMLSRYTADRAVKEGVGSAIGSEIAPPFKTIDAVIHDIQSGQLERSVRSIPQIGENLYWWFGAGSEPEKNKKKKNNLFR